jgi:two-component system, NarL family, nitrate/nitrite response regulator NarL
VSKSTPTLIVTRRVLQREGIASLLQITRYKVVAIAAEPAELPPDCCPKGQLALAIVGVDLQNGDLEDADENIRLLRTLMPDGRVVLLIETNGSIDLQRVLSLVPDACIFNLDSRDTLLKVLELALTDQRVFVFDKSIVTTTKTNGEFTNAGLLLDSLRLGTGGQVALSAREREVLFYLAEGKSNKVIARRCKISEATVKVHLKAILRKTQTQNRTQAAIWAIEHGFRDPSSEQTSSRVTDTPTLSPAGATSLKKAGGSGVITTSRDDGFQPGTP